MSGQSSTRLAQVHHLCQSPKDCLHISQQAYDVAGAVIIVAHLREEETEAQQSHLSKLWCSERAANPEQVSRHLCCSVPGLLWETVA